MLHSLTLQRTAQPLGISNPTGQLPAAPLLVWNRTSFLSFFSRGVRHLDDETSYAPGPKVLLTLAKRTLAEVPGGTVKRYITFPHSRLHALFTMPYGVSTDAET